MNLTKQLKEEWDDKPNNFVVCVTIGELKNLTSPNEDFAATLEATPKDCSDKSCCFHDTHFQENCSRDRSIKCVKNKPS